MRIDKYSKVEWSSLVYYDESSPSCIRWKDTAYSGMYYNVPVRLANGVAGSVNKLARWQIGFNRKTYSTSRIVWILHNGNIPAGLVVDHINGNPLDNRIENLRAVDQRANTRNCAIGVNNTSGITGVYFNDTQSSSGCYWTAVWVDMDGKKHVKYFSIKKHGSEAAKQMAIEYRTMKIAELNASGAGYTDRHGA